MKELRGLIGLLLLVAAALVSAWFLLRGGEAAKTNGVAIGDDFIESADDAPLEMPETRPAGPATVPPEESVERLPADKPDTGTPAPAALPPDLDAPDYGVAIRRGGAVAEFELQDLNGVRVPASSYSVALWRRVGNYWIKDEARVDQRENVVRCDGLRGLDEYSGLEQGDYELELSSQAWGNFRHEFHVGRGEQKRDQLLTPNWRQLVRFRFTHPDGTPVSHLPAIPHNKYTSEALEPKEHPGPSCVALRDPPRIGMGFGGGGTFRSGYPDRGVRRKPDVLPLYPTNDGCWWVTVQAGADNTVTFGLEESVWGQAAYTLSDKFMTVREVDVTLRTPADFNDRLAEYGREVEGFPPGNDPKLRVEVVKPPREKFDPYTSEIKPGKTRVILEVAPVENLSIQISGNGKDVQTYFWTPGNVYCYDFDSDKPAWYRFVCGPLYSSEWRALDTAGGGIKTVADSLDVDRVRISSEGLSPTLRAFALTIDLQLSVVTVEPEPTDVSSTAEEEDPSDKPNADLAENPNEVEVTDEPFVYSGRRPDTRNAAPAGASGYINLPLRPGNQYAFEGLLGGPRVSQADIDGRLLVRTHLRGAAQYAFTGRHNTFTFGPDGRSRFDALILNGEWRNHQTDGQDLKTVLKSGAIRPAFTDVLIARAVGPQAEGLPWVQGLLVDYEQDEVARQVREIASRWPSYRPLTISDYDAYNQKLAELALEPSEQKLRDALGDELYESFETDEQRLWYASQGAWYDTYRKVYSDDHGYIAIEKPKLTPGKCYVMYLWSNSKDEFKPDARFVFQVDENGVSDLGAIHLPGFLD